MLSELVREQRHERRGSNEHLLDGAEKHVYESSHERRVQPNLDPNGQNKNNN